MDIFLKVGFFFVNSKKSASLGVYLRDSDESHVQPPVPEVGKSARRGVPICSIGGSGPAVGRPKK